MLLNFYSGEPDLPLDAPLIDPIDILSGGLAGGLRGLLAREGAMALDSGIVSGGAPTTQSLIDELAKNGVKYTPEDIVAIGKNPSGEVVFLENGTAQSGLQHIVEGHAADFAAKGIPEAQIPEAVMKAATEGNSVGIVGSGPNARTIYEIDFNGNTQRIAVGKASNGYIVTAHPAN